MAGPNAKDLETIKDRKVVERYLQYAVELREQASCFVDQGERRFEALIKSFDPRRMLLELEFTELPNPKQLRFSFSVQGILYFAHGTVEARRGSSLYVIVDFPIFKLQRRDALRVKVLDSHNARVNVAGKAYVPHDLSATGISFVVMPDEEELFPLGRMIEGCSLSFVGFDCPVNLEVISVSRLRRDNERLLKVGLRFSGLSTAAEQRLAREAYLHTSKIWSRWI